MLGEPDYSRSGTKPLNAIVKGLVPVLRALTEADLDDLVGIEESVYPFPWTRDIFKDCLRVGYGCVGVQCEQTLAGYVIYQWGAGESHLLNLCVSPDWQRQNLGGLLLRHAVSHVTLRESSAMFLEVRPSNPVAIGMYKRFGFEKVGRRRDYYRSEGGREDAIVMRMELEPPGFQ